MTSSVPDRPKTPHVNIEDLDERLTDLNNRFDVILAKVGNASGDIVIFALENFTAAVVLHLQSKGENNDQIWANKLFQKMITELYKRTIVKSIQRGETRNGGIDGTLDFCEKDLGIK